MGPARGNSLLENHERKGGGVTPVDLGGGAGFKSLLFALAVSVVFGLGQATFTQGCASWILVVLWNLVYGSSVDNARSGDSLGGSAGSASDPWPICAQPGWNRGVGVGAGPSWRWSELLLVGVVVEVPAWPLKGSIPSSGTIPRLYPS